jgi:oligopeptidase B
VLQSRQISGVVFDGEEALYYTTKDATMRPYRVWRHSLLSSNGAKDDTLLYEEKNEQFCAYLSQSASKRFLFVCSESSETAEIHAIDLHQPVSARLLHCLSPRRFGHRYNADHGTSASEFLVVSNRDGAINNRIMYAPMTAR